MLIIVVVDFYRCWSVVFYVVVIVLSVLILWGYNCCWCCCLSYAVVLIAYVDVYAVVVVFEFLWGVWVVWLRWALHYSTPAVLFSFCDILVWNLLLQDYILPDVNRSNIWPGIEIINISPSHWLQVLSDILYKIGELSS